MTAGLQLWLSLYLWTCALELPVYAVFLRGGRRTAGFPFTLCLGLNLVTHPALLLLLRRAGRDWLVPGEALVIVVEGLLLSRLAPEVRRPLLAAASANLFSWLVGGALLGAG